MQTNLQDQNSFITHLHVEFVIMEAVRLSKEY